MDDKNTEDSIDQIMERIRAEVASRQAGPADSTGTISLPDGSRNADGILHQSILPEPISLPRPPGRVMPQAAEGGTFHVFDFLGFDDEEFLFRAFQTVLNRPPRPEEVAEYRESLELARTTHLEVLGELRYSEEGRDRAVAIEGLRSRYRLSRFCRRVPVLGYFVKWSIALVSLPQKIDALRREDAELRRRAVERSKREAALSEIVEGSLNSVAGRIEENLSQVDQWAAATAQTVEDLSQSLLARQLDAQRLDSLEMRILEIGQSLTDSSQHLAEIKKTVTALNEDGVAIENRIEEIAMKQKKYGKHVDNLKSVAAKQKTLLDGLEQNRIEHEKLSGDIAAITSEQKAHELGLKHNQEEHQALFDGIDSVSGELVGRIGEIEKFQTEYRSFTQELAASRGEHRSLIDHLTSLTDHHQKREEEQSAHVSNLEARVVDFKARQEALEALGPRMSALSKQFRNLERNALDKERRLTFLVEEVHVLHSDFEKKVRSRTDGHDPTRDSEYVAFTDRFRGTRDDVQGRQKIYLPYINALKIDLDEHPVLDAGCGRGEWLELLADAKISAKGFDVNTIMVKSCLEAGFDVEQGDSVGYLEKQKENTFGALTSFHVIEHLEYNVLLEFLEQCYRVLRKGGMILLETPNPSNMIVGSRDFYIDPTHRNPIPSETMHFLLDARGFRRLEILDVNPFEKELRLTGSKLAGRLNEFFYGPRDYAIIGYKE